MNKYYTLILSSLFLISCTDTADTSSQVAERYWQAIQQGDTETAQKLITKNSQDKFDEHYRSLESISIDNFVVDNTKTTATTIINPDAKTPGDEIIFETHLVMENKKWKVDLNTTHVPQTAQKEKDLDAIAEELSESIQKNVESLESVMSQGMGMLNDALRDGSEEMGKSMLDAMKELNSKMNESIERMKERRKKNQPAPKDTDDKAGEGLI